MEHLVGSQKKHLKDFQKKLLEGTSGGLPEGISRDFSGKRPKDLQKVLLETF